MTLRWCPNHLTQSFSGHDREDRSRVENASSVGCAVEISAGPEDNTIKEISGGKTQYCVVPPAVGSGRQFKDRIPSRGCAIEIPGAIEGEIARRVAIIIGIREFEYKALVPLATCRRRQLEDRTSVA